MMKRTIVAAGSAAFGIFLACSVNAASLNDDYLGAYYGFNPGSGSYETYTYPDVIGNPAFNISGMDVTIGATLEVSIATTYVNIVTNPDGIGYGDLWLSTNGYNPGESNSAFDHYLNGEIWEYALVLDQHDGTTTSGTVALMGVNGIGDYILAENTGTSVYRAGQEVLLNTQGKDALGFGTWWVTGDTLNFSIDASLLNLGPDDLGIRWAMTCANDIIEVSIPVDPVPEPATMLLFGAGLTGLAGLRLRKRK